MNRTPRLGKSGIEYLNCAWNFYSGCQHKEMGICQVDNCWAEAITKRMKHNYPKGFEPTTYPEAFLSPLYLKKPSIIGCAFMGDLFGDWVDPEQKIHADMPSGKASISMSLRGWIFTTIRQCPQHTFLFKTKCPKNLIKWSPFPDNCWVGVTATSDLPYVEAFALLANIEAKVKYISFEPLLGRISDTGAFMKSAGINWVIIGAQTNPYKPPEIQWVREIVEACDKAGTKVFLKDNLKSLFDSYGAPLDFYYKGNIRQEMPTIH